jgi:hypothetical protein
VAVQVTVQAGVIVIDPVFTQVCPPTLTVRLQLYVLALA